MERFDPVQDKRDWNMRARYATNAGDTKGRHPRTEPEQWEIDAKARWIAKQPTHDNKGRKIVWI